MEAADIKIARLKINNLNGVNINSVASKIPEIFVNEEKDEAEDESSKIFEKNISSPENPSIVDKNSLRLDLQIVSIPEITIDFDNTDDNATQQDLTSLNVLKFKSVENAVDLNVENFDSKSEKTEPIAIEPCDRPDSKENLAAHKDDSKSMKIVPMLHAQPVEDALKPALIVSP